MRAGLSSIKIGMSRMMVGSDKFVPVTLLKVDESVVVDLKTEEKHGYNAVRLASVEKKLKHTKKPEASFFKKEGLSPYRYLNEFRVSADNLLQPKNKLLVDHFSVGQYVDVQSFSKGKGFAGVIKRHNFRSLRATHGVSLTHRSHGSTGNRQDPGRVFKGKKMAGHLGNKRVTIQNLEVMYVDVETGVIGIKGSVPGAQNSVVLIRDAVKK